MAKTLFPRPKNPSRETAIDWEESVGVFRDPHEPSVIIRTRATPLPRTLFALYAMQLFYGDIRPAWMDRVVSASSAYKTYADACDALTNPKYSTFDQEVSDGFAHIAERAAVRGVA